MAARDEVARLLAAGWKQSQIAQELGLSPGRVSQLAKAVRTCASPPSPPAPPAKSKAGAPRRNTRPPPGPNRGSFQPGDPRAGAPPGNKNAVTTGEFEAIWLDQLDEDELAVYGVIDVALLRQTDEEIRLITIRERRMLRRIAELAGVDFTVVERRYEKGTGPEGPVDKSQSHETGTLGQIQAIEEALTRVQKEKAKLLELKHKILAGGAPPEANIQEYTRALEAVGAEVWAGEEPDPDPDEGQERAGTEAGAQRGGGAA